MTEKNQINVTQRITESLTKSQDAVERALVTLDDGEKWHQTHQGRGKYLASWVRKGRKLNGTYVDEARKLVLQYVGQLIQPSLEKTRQSIKSMEERLVWLRQWEAAIVDELNRLPFDDPPKERQSEVLIDGKTISEICREEGLY